MTKSRLLLGSLFGLACTEIIYGFCIARLNIISVEAIMWLDLGLDLKVTAANSRAFSQHFGELRRQWEVVGWFGIITALLAILLFVVDRGAKGDRRTVGLGADRASSISMRNTTTRTP